jgi:hypothetical protein
MDQGTVRAWIVALIATVITLAGAVVGYRLPACQAEDGGPYPCVWDGPTRGNQTGHRVVVWSDD